MSMIHIDSALQALVEEQRRYLSQLKGPFAPPPAVPPVVLPAEEVSLPGSPAKVRVIRPAGVVRGAYLHIHGGGFMHGNAAMGDVPNSMLARELSLATVSVEYRLAPEHPHPAAVDDCVAAARWLIEQAHSRFGTQRLLIGGESVGASLAVLTLLKLRDEHPESHRFAAANLVVGNYDFSMTPSQRAATPRHFLSPAHLAEMRAAAFPGCSAEALRSPAISSLYADLHDLPPALFTVGTGDAVLDDSLFMAARWQLAGNVAQLELYPEAPHLFMTYATGMAAEAHRRMSAFLNSHL